MSSINHDRILKLIAECTDPEKLRNYAKNALDQDAPNIARAAKIRLFHVLPAEQPGTLEHDVWKSIHALEDALTTERSRTTRLSRTRQKIAKVAEQNTVGDLLEGKPSDGFRMLLERNMPELTFEAVALRHQDRFSEIQLRAATARLLDAGVDVSAVTK